MQNLKINFSAKEIFDLSLDSIKNKKPFLNVRIGDGEMKVLLSKKNDEKSINIFKSFCRTQLGLVILDKDRIDIIKNIDKTIIKTNILGIPTGQMLMGNNPYWSAAEGYIKGLYLENKINPNDKNHCSAGIHYHLLSGGFIDELVNNVKKVVIISGRDVKHNFLKKYSNIKDIEYYKIPPEQNFEINPTPSNFYPKIYEEIKKSILEKDRSGELLLYGAGFAGKDLGLHFKFNGGVALDIGSVFDIWDGRITRGKGKGKGKAGPKGL